MRKRVDVRTLSADIICVILYLAYPIFSAKKYLVLGYFDFHKHLKQIHLKCWYNFETYYIKFYTFIMSVVEEGAIYFQIIHSNVLQI